MSQTSLYTALSALIAQIAGVAVAFGAFTTTQEHILVTAAGSVLATVFAVIGAVEQWKTVKLGLGK